jgi:hypothetical protein
MRLARPIGVEKRPLRFSQNARETVFWALNGYEDFCQKWQYLNRCETVIKHASADVGEIVEMLREHYEQAVHEQEAPAPEGTDIVTFTRDGTCVNTRGDGWRQAQVGAVTCYANTNEVDENDDPIRDRLRPTYVGQMPEESKDPRQGTAGSRPKGAQVLHSKQKPHKVGRVPVPEAADRQRCGRGRMQDSHRPPVQARRNAVVDPGRSTDSEPSRSYSQPPLGSLLEFS